MKTKTQTYMHAVTVLLIGVGLVAVLLITGLHIVSTDIDSWKDTTIEGK